MDRQERNSLIEKYKHGYQAVISVLESLSDEDLDRVPSRGQWTAKQVVHHLGDSEMTGAIRLRRLVAEESPEILGYDENEFAMRLHYERPIDGSLEAFHGARRSSTELLESLSDEEWKRSGTHSEIGPYSVETWLRIYADHAHDHAEQIRQAGTHASA